MTRTGFSALHRDIIESHILNRLDGPTLASLASCSTTLHNLISSQWSIICQSTWPCTNSTRLTQLIASFPPRAFFSQAYPLPSSNMSLSSKLPSKLISAVDIHYKGKLVFTKVQETTKTSSAWFRFARFGIILHDEVQLPFKHADTCEEILRDTTLTWILIDPIERRAVNLSSHKAVTANRNSVTGEVQLRFDSILAGHVRCGIMVTCGGSKDDEGIHVRELGLVMEDVEGRVLNGRDSLVILHAALEGKKGNGRNRVVEARRRYDEFMEMKRERKPRTKSAVHVPTSHVACLVSAFVAFLCFVFYMR